MEKWEGLRLFPVCQIESDGAGEVGGGQVLCEVLEKGAGPQAEPALGTLGGSSHAEERLLAPLFQWTGFRAADWTARCSWPSVAGCQSSTGLSLTVGRAGGEEPASPERVSWP